MFWQCGHTLPFSAPCDVSHKFPTFFDPVPNGPGPDAALMPTVSPSFWTWRFTANLSKLLTHHHFCRSGPLLTWVSHKCQELAVQTRSSALWKSLITSSLAWLGQKWRVVLHSEKWCCPLWSGVFSTFLLHRQWEAQKENSSTWKEEFADIPTSVQVLGKKKGVPQQTGTLLLIKQSLGLTLHISFHVQAMMHQPNPHKSGGTRVLVQPPCGADTSENGSPPPNPFFSPYPHSSSSSSRVIWLFLSYWC